MRVLCDAVLAAFWGLSWEVLAWGVGVFLVSFFGSLLAVGFLVVRLPATFFLESHDRRLWIDRHPALRWTGIVLKNLLGAALVAVGIALSLPGVPGQGLLTILIGVVLLDFPGKRRLERKIVGLPRIFKALNALRARFGRPPLELDEKEPEERPPGEPRK